jgi:hypothetical protein
MKRIGLLLFAAVTMVGVAGCGNDESDCGPNPASVCRDRDAAELEIFNIIGSGQGVPSAKLYDPTRQGIHPVVALRESGRLLFHSESYDSDTHTMQYSGYSGPPGWEPENKYDTELVALAEPLSRIVGKTCTYGSGGVHAQYDVVTKKSVRLRLFEAQTARLVFQTEIIRTAPNEPCSASITNYNTGDRGAVIITADYVAELRPYVEK